MNTTTTSREKVDLYISVIDVFRELFKELKDLGKKKPESILSETKVRMLNRVLEDVKICLKDETFAKYLDLLDSDALPQYGDAILVLSQYEGSLQTFKDKYYRYWQGSIQWAIEDGRRR
jgi:hypothetical protein